MISFVKLAQLSLQKYVNVELNCTNLLKKIKGRKRKPNPLLRPGLLPLNEENRLLLPLSYGISFSSCS